jgi:hypothetical protein
MRRGVHLWGTKGASHAIQGLVKIGEPLLKTPSGKKLPHDFHIIQINTGALKDLYHYGIEKAVNGEGRGALFLHAETETEYARYILAEEKRIDAKTGVVEWKQVRPENHLF